MLGVIAVVVKVTSGSAVSRRVSLVSCLAADNAGDRVVGGKRRRPALDLQLQFGVGEVDAVFAGPEEVLMPDEVQRPQQTNRFVPAGTERRRGGVNGQHEVVIGKGRGDIALACATATGLISAAAVWWCLQLVP